MHVILRHSSNPHKNVLARAGLCLATYVSVTNFPFRKTERKINFEQFKSALEMVSKIKYGTDPNGLKTLENLLCKGKGPQAVGVTVCCIHVQSLYQTAHSQCDL